VDAPDALAADFLHAFDEHRWPRPAVPDFAQLDLARAHQVQERVAALRFARGETLAGWKVGCTSAAIRAQFGLDEPIRARLFHPRVHSDGARLPLGDFHRLAIEPEIVLHLAKPLAGDAIPDAELLDAIDSVHAGIELHHYHFWHQPPTLPELVASGGIHAGLIVGSDRVGPGEVDWHDASFRVAIDDREVTAAAAREIMGGPLESLRWLAASLHRDRLRLEPGQLVIPGSPTELVRIGAPCRLAVTIDGVGRAAADFTPARTTSAPAP